MTKQDIIKELLAPYIADPSIRAVLGSGRCINLTEDGRKCALSRAALKPYEDTYENVFAYEQEEYLPVKYHGHPHPYLWMDMIVFHDLNVYYTDTGLSKEGEAKYNEILNRYK